MDRAGNEARPAQFNDAYPFIVLKIDESTASVSKGVRFFKIDVDGNVVKGTP